MLSRRGQTTCKVEVRDKTPEKGAPSSTPAMQAASQASEGSQPWSKEPEGSFSSFCLQVAAATQPRSFLGLTVRGDTSPGSDGWQETSDCTHRLKMIIAFIVLPALPAGSKHTAYPVTPKCSSIFVLLLEERKHVSDISPTTSMGKFVITS